MSETRDDDLKRDPALTALYRAAGDEAPPPALDAEILAAAHRAVGARPRVAGHPFMRSWRGALSAAAVLVLSVSLVIVMREEAPDVLTPQGVEEQRQADSKLKYDLTAKNGEREKTGQPARADADTPKGVGLKPSSAMPPSGLAMRAPPTTGEVGRTAKDAFASKPEAPPVAATLAKRREDVAQMNERADRPVPESKLERPAVKQEPAKEFVPAPPPRMAEAPAERQAQAGALSGRAAEPAAPPKVAALDAQREADTAERSQARDNRARSASDSLASAPATAQVAPAAKPAPAPMKTQREADLPPEKWLERIEELRKQGRLNEARASLAEFKKRYPDYRLPDSLRDGIK